ncbi:vWA domain-containing protein [Salinirubrum litoreum]|uniref:VWA domain-containing protein n=1 Tax=Salinirubrum litoreum TaxID=1126234 RepID=A0ABD5RAH6_9EURY|nr:vWA domain-containing protein [Salinirubrum litoreum]
MTSDNQFNVSRRKVLAGLGTIGIASAGAGLGTTAFFSDEESVAASLEAGRLDLKLDYRATYNTWLPQAETEAIVNGNVLPDPDQEFNYLVGQAPDIRAADGSAVTGNEWAQFTRASDACDVVDENSLAAEIDRVGEFIGRDYDYRVDGDDDYLGPEGQIYIDGEPGLKFDLNDVKPKDEGEATISIHTCGNPAFLWLRSNLDENAENDLVEPEDSAGDTTTDVGELADYIYARLWDDVNCNNRPDGGAADIAVVFDKSCSMTWLNPFAGCNDGENTEVPGKLDSAKFGAQDLYDVLLAEATDSQIALISYNSDADLDYDLAPVTSGNENAYDTAVDDISNSGSTAIADGINAAKNVLLGDNAESTVNGIDGTGNSARADAEKVMIVLSDGFPNDPNVAGDNNIDGAEAAIDAAQRARDAGITMYTITYQVDGFPIPELIDLMGTGFDSPTGPFGFDTPDGEGLASTDSTALVATVDQSALGTPSSTEIVDAFTDIAVSIAGGDTFLYQGSLAGLLELAENGIPLSTASVDSDDDSMACFPPGVYCYAFDWYFVCEPEDFDLPSDVEGAETLADELAAKNLPLDVNVAQTDSIEFGFDFAAIQCRHNMENANPFGEEEVQTPA